MAEARSGKPPEARPDGPRPTLLYPPVDGPHAAAMAQSSQALAAGDFAAARRHARAAQRADATEEERAFAAVILERTAPDPWALGVAVVCLMLLIGTAGWVLGA